MFYIEIMDFNFIYTGIGGGLSTTPGIIIVSLYFDKHRALANGICVSGTAAGSFVFPMLIEHLCANFGFHGTILILGGCMLHVCASAALYRPVDDNDDAFADEEERKSADGGLRAVVSSAGGLDTGTTYVGSADPNDDLLLDRKYIEHLFLEETMNRLNDNYNKNKMGNLCYLYLIMSYIFNLALYTTHIVNISEKSIQPVESDDEVKDTIGETRFMKPIKSIRSSSLLHSVEDLSTDSTCVYKARSGFDSNRSSRRRAAPPQPVAAAVQSKPICVSTDEMLVGTNATPAIGQPAVVSTMQSSRGLSKSMIIPTPISDFSEYDEDREDGRKGKKTCCDRIRK